MLIYSVSAKQEIFATVAPFNYKVLHHSLKRLPQLPEYESSAFHASMNCLFVGQFPVNLSYTASIASSH